MTSLFIELIDRGGVVSANVETVTSEQLRRWLAPHTIFFHSAATAATLYRGGFRCGNIGFGVDMERSLIWIGGDAKGWACSNCRWKFPVPTLLSGEEAKGAYDRLAAAKFREHQCEAGTSFFAPEQETKLDPAAPFAVRARTLIKRGYTPKVAAELVLHEMEFEHGSDSRMMEKAHAEAEDFLQKVRKGLI